MISVSRGRVLCLLLVMTRFFYPVVVVLVGGIECHALLAHRDQAQEGLHSSVGRASHRYHGGHGFESRWSLDFFRLLLSNCLNWKIYCDDHSSLWSITAVHIYELFHIYFTSIIKLLINIIQLRRFAAIFIALLAVGDWVEHVICQIWNSIIMGCLLLSSTCLVFVFAGEIACLLIWRLFFPGIPISDDWQCILVACYQPHKLDFWSMRTVSFGKKFSSAVCFVFCKS